MSAASYGRSLVASSPSFRRNHTSRQIVAACVAGSAVESAMVWRFGWSAALPAFLYFGAVVVVIGSADLSTRRVPNRVVLPAYVIGPGFLVIASAVSGPWSALVRAGVAMALLSAFFLVLALAFPGGMGMGDCKLAGVIGLYLGWLGWSDLAAGVVCAFLAASMFVVARRVLNPSLSRADLPFAPFMAGGAVVAVLFAR